MPEKKSKNSGSPGGSRRRRKPAGASIGLTAAELQAAAPSHETKTLPGFKQVDLKSATRKGQTGDWQNHFDDRLRRIFKEEAGQALVQAGYETGLNW